MKKLISLTLALITLLLALASCTPTQGTAPSATPSAVPTETPTQSNNNSEQFALGSSRYIYNSFVYYKTAKYSDFFNDTLKYVNLKNPNTKGVLLYNDTFGGEDPFNRVDDAYIMVDEDATRDNGGMPILIIALTTNDTENLQHLNFKIVRFDTATNKTTTIFEDKKSSEYLDGACLVGDTIYFKKWTRNDKMEYKYSYFSINKHGGEVQKYNFKLQTETEFLGYHKGKLYLKDIVSNTVIATDLAFSSYETLISYEFIGMQPYVSEGYLYYTDNPREIEKDGLKLKVGDIFRHSLEDFKNTETELVLENVAGAAGNGKYIIFGSADEAELYAYATIVINNRPILRLYNIETKENTIVSDKRNAPEGERHSGGLGCNNDYVWFTLEDETSCYVNIKTGEMSSFSHVEK